MKKIVLFVFISVSLCTGTIAQSISSIIKKIPQPDKEEQVQIMLLGTTHFGQEGFYKDNPKADLFSPENQKEVAHINHMLAKYKPDMIMIETVPEEQGSVDSLYALFKTGKLALQNLAYGRAERYQFGFNLAKQLHLNKVYGVDYYESVSNRMLNKGDNIEYYQNALTEINSIVGQVDKGFKEGKFTLTDYLLFMNDPQVLDMSYRLIYLTPAKVRNSEFTNPPVQYIDTAYINKKYIGAEFVASFYEREIKIYSNIVTTQLAQKSKKILVVMGQRHAASLTKIFANDPAYKVVPLDNYVK